MKPFLLDAPINPLSFGNVTVNLLRELHRRNADMGLWPIGGELDLSSYDISKEFLNYLNQSFNQRFDFLNKEFPSIKIWHINGSENRKNPKQFLYSFYESNQPTPVEVKLVFAQDSIAFSSSYAAESFKNFGVDAHYIPLGVDAEVKPTGDTYYGDKLTHFVLMGKFEKRKHTARIIKTWIKKYGNNPKYLLTCCVSNPFMSAEQLQGLINHTLEGKNYTNINFLPYLKTNSEVNELMNSADIDLTGLSGGEGWNLPAFNCTALGKWSIVLNATAHRDWATKENSILIEPTGEMDVEDGMFFLKHIPFNHGTFFTWNEDQVVAAMEEAEKKAKTENKEGLKLNEQFTYAKTLDALIELINK